MKSVLYQKVIDGIESRYSKDNLSYNIFWDLDLREKIDSIYNENKDKFDSTLRAKLDEILKDYKVDNYVISNYLSTIITEDESYQATLKDFLGTRIDDILDKI